MIDKGASPEVKDVVRFFFLSLELLSFVTSINGLISLVQSVKFELNQYPWFTLTQHFTKMAMTLY